MDVIEVIAIKIWPDIKNMPKATMHKLLREEQQLKCKTGEAIKGLTQKARIAYGTNKML